MSERQGTMDRRLAHLQELLNPVGAATTINRSHTQGPGDSGVDDTLESWERWAVAISAGRSGDRCGLFSIEDPSSRRRTGDQPAGSLGDEELALRFRRGDHQAFDLLYARYRAPLLRFVRRTMPNPSDLEEVI